MENFIVSARKYRPARFKDVVGQQHVTQTLQNAVRQQQLAQAFLFCGPRGVGKTTCARILAKVINCENVTPDIEPCNECSSCVSFNTNASFNIHELDAASNNSVDDIRSLIEQVRIAPHQGKKKVYIIDEVHMLSTAAFNAFLKTLEEPPPYAIFILATTEKQKILPTILSRCQIFDFNRIKVEDAATYLKEIAEKENVKAEDDALHLIAQKADGAMRDALSMFDRLAIFGNNNIVYNEVIENLNILDYDYFFRLNDMFLAENISDVMITFDRILQKGFEGDVFITGLCEHLRNLMLCKDISTLPLIETSNTLRLRYRDQAEHTPLPFIVNAMNVLQEAETRYKLARNKRLLVEIALVKVCYLQRAITLAANGNSTATSAQPDVKKKPVDAIAQPPQPSTKPFNAAPSLASITATKPTQTQVASQPATTIAPQPTAPKMGMLGNLQSFRTAAQQQSNNNEITITEEQLSPDDFPEISSVKFADALAELIEQLRLQKKVTLHSQLKLYPPALVDNKRVEFRVNTSVLKEAFTSNRDLIAEFLKSKLGVSRINLQVVMVENVEAQNTPAKAMTVQERFDHLARKNPKLLELKNKLNMNLEFD